mgnify:CR=1 FL=1
MIRDTPLCYGMQELWRTHSYSSKNFRKNTREYGTINQNNMRIKKILPFILLVFLFISCEKEDFEIETNNQRTVFMYLPWSTNLTSYFYNNISDMEEAIQEKGLENERIIVFLSTSPSESEMFEITLNNGSCKRSNYSAPIEVPLWA